MTTLIMFCAVNIIQNLIHSPIIIIQPLSCQWARNEDTYASCMVAFLCQETESQECVWDVTSGEFECKVREEEETPAAVKFPVER